MGPLHLIVGLFRRLHHVIHDATIGRIMRSWPVRMICRCRQRMKDGMKVPAQQILIYTQPDTRIMHRHPPNLRHATHPSGSPDALIPRRPDSLILHQCTPLAALIWRCRRLVESSARLSAEARRILKRRPLSQWPLTALQMLFQLALLYLPPKLDEYDDLRRAFTDCVHGGDEAMVRQRMLMPVREGDDGMLQLSSQPFILQSDSERERGRVCEGEGESESQIEGLPSSSSTNAETAFLDDLLHADREAAARRRRGVSVEMEMERRNKFSQQERQPTLHSTITPTAPSMIHSQSPSHSTSVPFAHSQPLSTSSSFSFSSICTSTPLTPSTFPSHHSGTGSATHVAYAYARALDRLAREGVKVDGQVEEGRTHETQIADDSGDIDDEDTSTSAAQSEEEWETHEMSAHKISMSYCSCGSEDEGSITKSVPLPHALSSPPHQPWQHMHASQFDSRSHPISSPPMLTSRAHARTHAQPSIDGDEPGQGRIRSRVHR